MMARAFLLALMVISLSSCRGGGFFAPPEIALPESFREGAVTESKAKWKEIKPEDEDAAGDSWWKIFDDEVLNGLESKAAEGNPSLQAAAARVEQARALARLNAPDILPNLTLGGNATRQAAPTKPIANTFDVKGRLVYEADLFNRVKQESTALEYEADATDYLYHAVRLSLEADVAARYFSIRALDNERHLLRDLVAAQKESVRIMQSRFTAGDAPELDLKQAQGELAGTEAELASLDRRRQAEVHALAVLLGEMPSAFSWEEVEWKDRKVPKIPAGLPSGLLARRPDIAAAMNNMAAANARIGAAKAAYLPDLTLTAEGGFQSSQMKNLFTWSSRQWVLGQVAGLALSLPLFDNGRRSARLDAMRASYDAAVAQYRETVLTAFRDVEDSLSAQNLLAVQETSALDAADAARRALDLARQRYAAGDSEYFDVAAASRVYTASARTAVVTSGERLSAAVLLIRALGGGWGNISETP